MISVILKFCFWNQKKGINQYTILHLRKKQMPSGWWELSRETISLLYLRHDHFSCGIFFCLIPLPLPQCIAKSSNAISITVTSFMVYILHTISFSIFLNSPLFQHWLLFFLLKMEHIEGECRVLNSIAYVPQQVFSDF